MDADYGEPVGAGVETGNATGVFTRNWTNTVVTYNCNTGLGTFAKP